MEQMNFHKQKLYSLIAAGAALIAMILPWAKVSIGGYGGGSANGFHGEGLITLLGIAAVAVACFMGDKSRPFEGNFKNIALGGFGAIIAGAVIAFINVSGSKYGSVIKPGIGLWLAIAAGVVGLLFLLGVIKFPDPKPKI
jgi:hypothetical protein